MPHDFLVSADGHIVEPPDLYITRVPKHLRSLAMWEEDFDVELNANWLAAAAMAAMDKAWTTGMGQNRDWWVGYWDDSLAPNEQAGMAQVFRLNDRYPYSLMPSEFVQRQIHVSFQEDPVAVANRQVTGVQTLLWGADYPHAEGTFGRSREAIAAQFDGVGSDDRTAILGGTLGGLLGVKAPAKA